ncbi:ABC transporter ATP-binding protein [Actinobacteria bacterium YIM 96077]|uniref:Nickel import system ATP-binding protein NikD n=1 Tax=Phytoactinopolyspora halophila TaxID=1981511 RepID=A0A329R2E0_9ACTN|nr:ABC transporter ATP-binding protein [Phytoactinopolyspora halophila]AYY12029.1 ABC transporter ATP-binding protein [Actinobacteria bacterium YIM 96077]RAW18737.1 ABC transporter ATP-binding protein [Phytoactinopolyspora halophila]
MTAGVLQLDNLSVRLRLPGGRFVSAVTGLSCTVRAGEVLALVGESGCGKSVLASTILGLLPGNAQVRGQVWLDDAAARTELLRAPEHELATRVRGRRIGLIPQSAGTHLTPVRTARSQLAEALAHHGSEGGGAEIASRVDELAQQVGLDPDDLYGYPHELSGGMTQRVVTALALAGNPLVLVADEPTAGLDRALVDHTVDLFRFVAGTGRAVLFITHDLAAAGRVADHLAVMYAGRLLELGPAREVLADPWHDYTRGLLAALPSGGLQPLPGHPPSLTELASGCAFHRRVPGECSGDPTLTWHGGRAVACR